ncbi:KPN_02809 family neutral zinc metallopeptidase [Acidipropionibacterium timonense]|uniref:KPN_02809 family neutral zinc metallopeptidase n=1 Tax=Acidipropionibacterium timonense TaxID=2161818 RepID=UPI0010319150|nr:neutral zinc metallopeptidase [Acidipropionibacterium timonense]
MDFKDDAQIDQDAIDSSASRGGGGGGRIAIGGGAGVIVLIIALFLGIDPANILGSDTGETGTGTSSVASTTSCRTGADVRKDPNCRWAAYATSINQYWATQIDGYTKARVKPFTNAVDTGCGHASAQMGPFYCSADKLVYLDTNFLGELLQQLGTQTSTAAEAYVIAHEYGHHAQDLIGTLSKAHSSGSQTGAHSASVRLELQADCYAGAYLKWAADNPDDLIENVTSSDIEKIVAAAKSVGDDHIQEQQQGQVDQDAWTHGSSAMRIYWTKRGFASGSPKQCDTFSTNNLEGR